MMTTPMFFRYVKFARDFIYRWFWVSPTNSQPTQENNFFLTFSGESKGSTGKLLVQNTCNIPKKYLFQNAFRIVSLFDNLKWFFFKFSQVNWGFRVKLCRIISSFDKWISFLKNVNITDFVFKKGSIEKNYIKHLKMMNKSTLIFHYVNVFHGRVDTVISVQTTHTDKFIIS